MYDGFLEDNGLPLVNNPYSYSELWLLDTIGVGKASFGVAK